MAKYSYIKTLSLKEDNNEYRVGVYGSNESKKCEFLINDKPLFEGIPYNDEKSISVVDSGFFIKLSVHGTNFVIRDGKIVFFTNSYDVVNAHAMIDHDADGDEFISDIYLIVVSRDDGLKGVYSTKKWELVLPFKYSTIDINSSFTIILGEKINLDEYDDETKLDMLSTCMRMGEYMQIGDYSKEHDCVSCKRAEVYQGSEVCISSFLSYRYWDDGFKFGDNIDNSHLYVDSNLEKYTLEDSLYDALGGEMDAIWNID